MLLTLTLLRPPATDLGFLLHKHPDRVQEADLGVGRAHVFYPEASEARCTAALLLDLDPVSLVRGRPPAAPGDGRDGAAAAGPIGVYVTDRPYVASSFLSVAVSRAFGSALNGRCAARPELAAAALPLEATVAPVRARGGAEVVRRLFAPLGYDVLVEEAAGPEDGPPNGPPDAPLVRVALSGRTTLQRLLSHLYVLVPVLDDEKHYWVAEDEIDKLLRRGEGWLAEHPDRALIARRYLGRGGPRLARMAAERLAGQDGRSVSGADDEDAAAPEGEGSGPPSPQRLAERRVGAVLSALAEADARRVVDLGCGDGRLLEALLRDARFAEVVGVDASVRALERARRRLGADRMPEAWRARLRLVQSALTYRDPRLAGYDAAVLSEVVEHLDPERLPALERAVFGCARPAAVVVTTPNREWNARYPGLAGGGRLRHADHRFEFTRADFAAWASRVAAAHGYEVRRLSGVGDEDPALGRPTQMAVFRRCA